MSTGHNRFIVGTKKPQTHKGMGFTSESIGKGWNRGYAVRKVD